MLHSVESASPETEPQPDSIAVEKFLRSIPDPNLREDAIELAQIMETETGQKPIMWGPAIIGFGRFEQPSHSYCLHDGLELGFSPRCACGDSSARIVLCLRRYSPRYADFLGKLGEVNAGHAFISFRRLKDVDVDILRDLIRFAWGDIEE